MNEYTISINVPDSSLRWHGHVTRYRRLRIIITITIATPAANPTDPPTAAASNGVLSLCVSGLFESVEDETAKKRSDIHGITNIITELQ